LVKVSHRNILNTKEINLPADGLRTKLYFKGVNKPKAILSSLQEPPRAKNHFDRARERKCPQQSGDFGTEITIVGDDEKRKTVRGHLSELF
jgi:hypothetical protein